MPPRSVLAVLLAALALAPAASGLSLAALGDAGEAPVRAVTDITGYVDQTVTLPLGAPVPADSAGIGPGALLFIDIEGSTFACTANYVWRAGGAAYLGAAGHCFLPVDKTSTHGPDKDYDASDIRVRVCVSICRFGGQLGFTLHGPTVELGEVVYARQTRNGLDLGNDFGLVRIPEAHLSLVRYDIPVWGHAQAVGQLGLGDRTCHYGNAGVFGETFVTKARLGVGVIALPDGSWRAAIPSFQGDSGAAVATCTQNGANVDALRAVGLLTHLTGTGVAGTTMPRAQQLAAEAGIHIVPALTG